MSDDSGPGTESGTGDGTSTRTGGGSESSSSAGSGSDVDETIPSFGTRIGERSTRLTRLQDWLLVEGDRLFIAGSLTVAVFVGLLALGELDVISFVNDASITRISSGMIAGTFSLVTLVVSINQLILSREFATADESRDALGGVMAFRTDVAEAAGVPATPAAPTKLLELLVVTVNHRAGTLADAVADHDEPVRTEVLRYTNTVQERSSDVEDTLEHSKFGTFDALSAAIGYDDAWQLYVARHLRSTYADSLSDDAAEGFEELIDALALFTVAREHFKTTYLQRELTRFSQLTIYSGVPAILSAVLLGFLYADLGGASVPLTYLPVLVSALVAVVVSPLALLVAYILRTATVTRRTASIGPMLPQKDPDEGPYDVSRGQGGGPATDVDIAADGGET